MNTITGKLNQFIHLNESPLTIALKKSSTQLPKLADDIISLSFEGKTKSAENATKGTLNVALSTVVDNNKEINKTASGNPLDKQIKLLQEK